MKADLLSVREYAEKHAITEQAAYKQIKTGKLQTVTLPENGKPKLYIILSAADPEPGPLPEAPESDTEAAAGARPAAGDPDTDPEPQPSPRARAGTQEGPQRPQDPAQSEIMITALINQLETKDKQIAELTEIISRFQELQAHNQMLLEQHSSQGAAAAAGDPSEVVISEPDPEAAAGDPRSGSTPATVAAADPKPPRMTFRERLRKIFFEE